jgi:branched-chain amino acid transport system ATP-binding protein
LGNSLTIEAVDAGYGAVKVLSGVSINVGSGETVVLLGTNGNGKTTLMRCITGQIIPTRGSITATIDRADC